MATLGVNISKLRGREIQVALICQKSGGYPDLVLNFENNLPLSARFRKYFFLEDN